MIAERSYEPDELFRCFGDNPSEAATKRRVERRFEFTEVLSRIWGFWARNTPSGKYTGKVARLSSTAEAKSR
jgi:hypothetical protein